ncbi:metalloregulator ArsR/SmtB family transcription factor [Epidermidibacterium keratini]|uniref:Metalloregulator ArsR/SmtB family transcription factor n=1 Tax=Epidermidibacterium keratini TaxID=1891644 RepID=A0A7L4YRZ0_9ACTN|nr:helix-turn-helix domain-containing protein [Epidermidibacterium keratini]QHC01818.1 metalloregulator ArsR/SmtB family transcription factor [Epidermidibacterium keratini]
MHDEPDNAYGDVNISAVAGLFADESRSRILMALGDGRELPASVIAMEAGISAAGASNHLRKLLDAGLVRVREVGRHRYFRLANDHVGQVLEALAALAPSFTVSSFRESTRANALRAARSCYDHLAGRLAIVVCQGLLDSGAVQRTDGLHDLSRLQSDPLSAGGSPQSLYEVMRTPAAEKVFADLGLDLRDLVFETSRRPLLRPCVDWSEQAHHFGGRLGAALLHTWIDRGWIERRPANRSLKLLDQGKTGLSDALGVTVAA